MPYDPVDPLFPMQWYLSAVGIPAVWQDYLGENINISLFDSLPTEHMDVRHPDFGHNIIISAEQQALDNDSSPREHSTFIAGLLVASHNSQGISGIAPNATLSEYTTLPRGMAALSYADVGSCSFGPLDFIFDFHRDVPGILRYATLMNMAANYGRNGLGVALCIAAGNHPNADANVSNFSNANSSIAVGATYESIDDEHFSTPGTNVWVSAPGSHIISTTVVDDAHYSDWLNGYYDSSQGTSFSTPIVAGTVALMLAANPLLGLRDIKAILAYTANQVSDTHVAWMLNGANHANGAGLHYCREYGFGQIDAYAATRVAETWGAGHTLHTQVYASLAFAGNLTVCEDHQKRAIEFEINDPMYIENAQLTLTLPHMDYSHLQVTLESPAGTRSDILLNPAKGKYPAFDSDGLHPETGTFTFSSNHFFGEDSQGIWKLEIYDSFSQMNVPLQNAQIDLAGTDRQQPQTIIFTQELATNVTLSTAQSLQTINASAVSSNTLLDLHAGHDSQINQQTVFIEQGVLIPNAISGDGDDFLQGNELDNILDAGRGNDVLQGFEGSDTFVFRAHAHNEQAELDTIADFNPEQDLIKLIGFATLSFAELIIDQIDDNTVITLPNAQTLFLQGCTASSLSEKCFLGLADQLSTLSGDDRDNDLYGDDFSNILIGEDGDDFLSAGAGNNRLCGGKGNDIFFISEHAQQSDIIDDFDSFSLNERISLMAFDHIHGLEDLTIQQQDNDTYVYLANEQTLILSDIDAQNINVDDFLFYGQIIGSKHDDTIHGQPNADSIFADDGNDRIYSYDGNDTIEAGLGDDVVFGGQGDDCLYGNAGNDLLLGGKGNDQLHGGSGDDVLFISSGNDILSGGEGNDRFVIVPEADGSSRIIDFTSQNDYLDFSLFNDINNLQDVQMQQHDNDINITINARQHITIENLELTQLTSNNFCHDGFDFSLVLDEDIAVQEVALVGDYYDLFQV